MTTYCFSTDEECFHNDCEAETIEEAAKIAEEELALPEGETFYVGLRENIHPEEHLSGWKILEDIGEHIYEQVGELAEGWPEVATKDVNDLESRLRAVLVQWMEEVGCVPTFYHVFDTKTFIAGDFT